MRNQHWQKAIRQAAAPERVTKYLAQLEATDAAPLLEAAPPEQCGILAALLSGSEALSELLIQHPSWIAAALTPEWLAQPRREQSLRYEVKQILAQPLKARDYDAAFANLRLFKQREMLRIAARDLAHIGNVQEILLEISNVADISLNSVLQICTQQITERLGQPYHLDADNHWQPTEFCVLGLGKLGGQELNYSSDVDVIFIYSEEGSIYKRPPGKGDKPERGLTSHQLFTRLAEAFFAAVAMNAPEGQLYRIDLRLRPEGKAGPLVRSLVSYENYYSQWGQTWERMMLIKARCVAGNANLANEFLEMVQSFRYPRSMGDRVLKEIAAMKDRIENEVVKAGELDRNVKLGRGGIREIEFIVQMMQLLNAGRIPFLQGAQTLVVLQKLVNYQLVPQETATRLTAAYEFLRNVEHRLQMERNQQTHTIPVSLSARERLAALMGCKSLAEFEAQLSAHTTLVRAFYEKVFQAARAEAAPALPVEFEGAEAQWQSELSKHSFRDPVKALRLLTEFVKGPGFVHISQRTEDLAKELVPKFLALCPHPERDRTAASPKSANDLDAHLQHQILSDPDRVLARLDSYISAYGARATLMEMWTTNPHLFNLLLMLFDRSEFLAEAAIRTPDLVDELVLSGRLRRAKTSSEILADLRHGHADKDQSLWMRRYHQTERMRIGLRDILGMADFEQNLLEISALAEACLQYALEITMQKRRMKAPPFCIIGMGKLGGAEIDYGSDLDIIFVAGPRAKNLPVLHKMAAEIMELLSTQTEQGMVFKVDARLRPDGDKGMLVNTLPAYEDYYRNRAQLWEIQSLTRTRPVAGDMTVGAAFQALTAPLTNFKTPSLPLAAYTPSWKNEIARMRGRIEKERTPKGKDALAIKTGAGGLMDAEFIAQAFCLANGWQEANTLAALQRAEKESALPADAAALLIENYLHLRRIEGILRRWSYEGETVLPDDPAPYYRVSVRCGFSTPDAFRDAVAQYRQRIRKVYAQVFPGGVQA